MWSYVMQDIVEKLSFLPAAIVVGVAASLLCFFLFCSNCRRRKRLPLQTVFLIYLLMLVQVTILEREPGSRTDMNLKLFGTLGNARANAYVVENLLLFLPYGALLPLIWKRSQCGFICVAAGALTSVGIELIQLLTQRGYFQVDDIVVNTLGMVFGYFIYLAAKKCIAAEKEKR